MYIHIRHVLSCLRNHNVNLTLCFGHHHVDVVLCFGYHNVDCRRNSTSFCCFFCNCRLCPSKLQDKVEDKHHQSNACND